MLKIRLQRVGRKHEPSFRLVLTDSKNSTKSGRFKEILGAYDARKDGDSINAERAKYWMSMGAGLTDTVHNLFIKHKIIDAKKKNVLPKKTVEKKEEPVVEAASEQAPVAEEAPAPAEEASAPVEEVPQESIPEVSEMPSEESKIEEPAPMVDAPAEESSTVEETPAE